MRKESTRLTIISVVKNHIWLVVLTIVWWRYGITRYYINAVYDGNEMVFQPSRKYKLSFILQNKNCVQTLSGHTQNITAVSFHPDLPIILTGSEDGTYLRTTWYIHTPSDVHLEFFVQEPYGSGMQIPIVSRLHWTMVWNEFGRSTAWRVPTALPSVTMKAALFWRYSTTLQIMSIRSRISGPKISVPRKLPLKIIGIWSPLNNHSGLLLLF